MIAHSRALSAPALLAALLVVLLLGSAAPLEAQPEAALRVYVLRGGDEASDELLLQTLRAAGLEAVSGVETPAFDGSQADLRDYDAVVTLYNANWATPLLPAGSEAIERYVDQGGGLLAGEWMLGRSQLAALMPAIHCGSNEASSTTYTRAAPNPAINNGLPDSFPIALGNFGGSESCLSPRPEATVLYTSSNAGGGSTGAGLAAWNYGKGRVAAFSTMLGATELQSAAYRGLLQNTVRWLATTRDTTPPTIKQLTVSGAGALLAEREVTIELKASDAGGSGLGAYLIVEHVFSGNPAEAWSEARSSEAWVSYEQPGITTSWTLSETPGVHYLQVYVADRAGNVSRQPGLAFVNYRPEATPIPLALDELHIYRLAPGAGLPVCAQLSALSGNPDMYIGGLGLPLLQALNLDALVEQIGFTTLSGVYQLEVEGGVAGSYGLELSNLLSDCLPLPGNNGTLERRPRISVTALNPPEPVANPGALPAAPVDSRALAIGDALYLPLLSR